jgi:hypothetical protein
LEYKVHSQQYLDFDLRDIPENPNLALYEDTKYIKPVYYVALQVFPEIPTIAI